MIALTESEKMAYKSTPSEGMCRFNGIRVELKRIVSDGVSTYAIIDTPKGIDVRRVRKISGSEYIPYAGYTLFLFDFSRVL